MENNRLVKISSGILVIILLVVSFSVLLGILPSNKNEDTASAEDPPPGVEEDEIILPPDTPVPFSMEDCYDYILEFDLIQELLNLDYYVPPEEDPYDTAEPDEIFSELIQDNQFDYTYWTIIMYYGNLEVRVNANNLEIIYVHNSLISNGILTLEDAISEGQDIIDEFSPEIGNIEPAIAETTVIHKETDEEKNTNTIEGYSLIYSRMEQDIETADRIMIDLDSDGNLCLFSKKWNMIMPQDTTPDITHQEAINIAEQYLDGGGEITTKLMIVRPNYYWTYGMRYGFSNGELCWVVMQGEDTISPRLVFVEANNGEVVGGF